MSVGLSTTVDGGSKMQHRRDVLRLYKSILSLHQRQLDPQLRVIGDQYVRYDEFHTVHLSELR